MLPEAAQELFGRPGCKSALLSGGVFVLESNEAIIELNEAVVGDGDTEDIRREILEGGQATADRLRMHHPGCCQTCSGTCWNKSLWRNCS